MAKKKTPRKNVAKKATKRAAKKSPLVPNKKAVQTKVNKRVAVQYLIFVADDEDNGKEVMHAAPLATADASYLCDRVIPTLRPLSDEEYMTGPVIILRTLARFSYVLFEQELYWCAEWQPGLVVIRFSPHREMAWTGIRSPIPNFGRREPLPEDLAAYDEDAENHQYNLVFKAWDAQFDEDHRRWKKFKPASKAVQAEFEAALAKVNDLGDQLQARFGDDKSGAAAKKCQENMNQWLGEGIRLK
ncbi:hypothetical protein [Anatilimnocola floriformis]|uniref:hypothetical protein n=1 Tax=Anatilimnocola floriformis TaxID=2948575 RepID=UPI0020C28FDF|nr:hypothetical protein [Anatilimnocola floriformis]